MKKFIDSDFLLQTEAAKRLYDDFAKKMPIIDYHCHLPADQIAKDHRFANLSEIWLHGDHYKWRIMRANGVDESYCTGNRSDYEKFEKWAETVAYTLRNPLYHWTHLELQRYFGIREVLNPQNAKRIFDECSRKLQTKEYSVRNLLLKMNVKIICTTDDPTDTLEHHKKIKEDGFEIKVLPAFRADKAISVGIAREFRAYLKKLESVSAVAIDSYSSYLEALKQRHDFFASMGCSVADNGLEYMYAEDYTEEEVKAIFNKVFNGNELSADEVLKFKSAVLSVLAKWNWEKGWVQQFHLGVFRNANSRKLKECGPDAGWDTMGDYPQGKAMVKFLDRLDLSNQLAKSIFYNSNPSDNELMASMIGSFNDGSIPGKIQFGSAWWFLDQKDGMTRQMNALSNMGLLSRMVGMLTDSRSFLSYPRHEYFRRILCDLFGREIENGELPDDFPWVGKIIQDICYYNAKAYFGW
jgi:glucuronate isomerase